MGSCQWAFVRPPIFFFRRALSSPLGSSLDRRPSLTDGEFGELRGEEPGGRTWGEVEPIGIEPTTSGLQSRRSPN